MDGSDNGLMAPACTVIHGDDGSVLLRLDGELDMSNADALDAAVAEVVGSVTSKLILDVERLQFADSAAIALWVGWSQRVPRLEVRNPTPIVRRVIEAMGLTSILNPS